MLSLGSRNLPKALNILPWRAVQPSLAAFHGRSRIGNRDVVGYGVNGSYTYVDRIDFPMSAIRFKENTPDILALREKEKGDWKKLSLIEKKELYRASFRQTFAEIRAPTGNYKFFIGGFLMFFSGALWIFTLMRKYVYPPPPYSLTPEHQAEMLQAMIDMRVDPIEGLTSKYDYEKMRWKD